MLQVGWGGCFFEGGFSGFAHSFVSETRGLRVPRGWNGMTRAYLGNHISPQGRRKGSSNSERRKFTGDIYKCSLCVCVFVCVCVEGGGEKRKNVFEKKTSVQGLQ